MRGRLSVKSTTPYIPAVLSANQPANQPASQPTNEGAVMSRGPEPLRPFDTKAYDRAYSRAYDHRNRRTRSIFVGMGLCLRCGEVGNVYRQFHVNLKTGRESPDGWSVRHGHNGRKNQRTHYVSGVSAYPLSALRDPLRAIMTESV
jgi:hypothetical protein